MKQPPWNPTVYYTAFSDFMIGLERFGDKPAVCSFDRRGSKTVRTYAELCRDVSALRRGLTERGLAGRRIAVCGENSYAWIVAFLAVTSGGGVAICIDIEQPDETVRQMLSYAEADAVFASASMQPICLPLCSAEDSSVASIISLEAEAGKANGGSIAALIESGALLPDPGPLALSAEQQAAVVFTSGTTARAKAVMLTNGNLMHNAGAAVATLDLGESTFTGLPFYHAYGLTCGVICSLLRGTCLTVNGDLRTMLRDLRLSEAETVFCVPLLLEVLWKNARAALEKDGRLAEAETVIRRIQKLGFVARHTLQGKCTELRDLCLGSVRVIICGGAHMNTDIAASMEALGIKILQGYGITECSPLIAVNRNDFRALDTVGTLLPGYELTLEDGEILVRGPSVMSGYYKDEAATALALEDGWFHTGDLGELDGNHQLRITGRIKNLIVLKNGKKISPEKIEQLVLQIPMVKEAIVYGTVSGSVADDVRPAVSIYPDPQMTAGMEQFEILSALQTSINALNAELPSYQQLQMINIREKEFEKTASKKMLRASAGDTAASISI